MNTSRNTFDQNRRKANNGIEIPLLAQWIVILFVMGMAGLLFVYLKNQQHALGEQTRLVETRVIQLRAHNDALVAKITGLTSRGALQRKLEERYLKLVQIPETAIARMTTPLSSSQDNIMHTALR